MVHGAVEGVDPLEGGNIGRGETPGGHHAEVGRNSLAAVCLDDPVARLLIENGGDDSRVEDDILPQIEAFGHVVDIAQDLRLARVALAPLPFLLEFFGELIGVLDALRIASRAG